MTSAALLAVLADLVAETPGVERSTTAEAIVFSAEGRQFGAVEGDVIELRLDRAIASAALRTPDTSASERGPEWVRYQPASLEGYDLDRLEAWFGLAQRRAVSPGAKV